MRNDEFDLFMGYLGNGCTVCNKAVMEHGDYKRIAHISTAGNIKFYVPIDYIPAKDLLKIEHTANSHKENTKKMLQNELSGGGYCRILEEITNYTPWVKQKVFFQDLKQKTQEDKNQYIVDFYLANF